MTLTASRIYHCARCGRRLKPEQWIYSTWSQLRYCTSINDCDKRAQRLKRKVAA